MVTGQGAGTTRVYASFSGYAGSSSITVPGQNGLTISPSSATLNPGQGIALTATATYTDGSSSNVSSLASWSTSNSTIASVSSTGFVTANNTGTATITASYGGYSRTATITVSCTAGGGFACAYNLSSSASGSVSQGQSVYYRFYATAGSAYTVTLAPSSGDPDLYVYDPYQSQIGTSTAGGTTTDQFSFTANYTGYYYARVYGYSAAGYTGSVSGGGGGGGCGSNFSNACTLNGSTSGSISQGQSIYYKFYVNGGSGYTVSLSPSSGDPDLYVYDPYQNQIGSSTKGSGTTDQVSFTASYTGYYFVRVYGYSSAGFSLSVTGGGGGGCSNGTSFDCAITFSSTSGSISQGQSIYYKFYAYAGSSYTVRLTPSSGDPDLYVYDPNRSQIGSSAAGAGMTDQVSFTASSTGYYYVRV